MEFEQFLSALRKKHNPLEGSFNYALEIFSALPTTCPHIGDRDFSCGRSSIRIPDSVSGVIGVNGSGPPIAEIFVAAHQANGEVERRALILVQVGPKSVVFRIEERSTIKEHTGEAGGEGVGEKVVTNYRDIYLDIPGGDGVESHKIDPGSAEYNAFRELLPIAEAVREKPERLLCDGCAAKKYGLPGSIVR